MVTQNSFGVYVNIFFETTEIHLIKHLQIVTTDHIPLPSYMLYK